MTDPYQILGVPRTADSDQIKRAYRKLASQNHPDRGGDTARFQEIQAAYDTLSDPNKRSAHDRPQSEFFSNFGPGAHFDFESFFSVFGQRGNRHNGAKPRAARMTLWITLADVANPGPRTIAVGTDQGSQFIEITIPNGIHDGDSVQYPQLAPGAQDLIVTFRIHPNSEWQRKNSDVTTIVDVDFWTLILGGSVTASDLTRQQLEVTVPEKTAPNTVLRVRGHGVPDRQGHRGDLLIKLNAVMPAKISETLVTAIKNERKQ